VPNIKRLGWLRMQSSLRLLLFSSSFPGSVSCLVDFELTHTLRMHAPFVRVLTRSHIVSVVMLQLTSTLRFANRMTSAFGLLKISVNVQRRAVAVAARRGGLRRTVLPSGHEHAYATPLACTQSHLRIRRTQTQMSVLELTRSIYTDGREVLCCVVSPAETTVRACPCIQSCNRYLSARTPLGAK
jgi:hypothetical protein